MPRDLSPSPTRFPAGTVLNTQRDGAAVRTNVVLPHRGDSDQSGRIRVGGGWQLGGSGGMATQTVGLSSPQGGSWAPEVSPQTPPESPYRSSEAVPPTPVTTPPRGPVRATVRMRGIVDRVRVHGEPGNFGSGFVPGTKLFSDSPCVASEVPEYLHGARVLQGLPKLENRLNPKTPYDDSGREVLSRHTMAEYVSFGPSTETPIKVYVLYAQLDFVPAWLQRGFAKTGDVVQAAQRVNKRSDAVKFTLEVWASKRSYTRAVAMGSPSQLHPDPSRLPSADLVKLGGSDVDPVALLDDRSREWDRDVQKSDENAAMKAGKLHNYVVLVVPVTAKEVRPTAERLTESKHGLAASAGLGMEYADAERPPQPGLYACTQRAGATLDWDGGGIVHEHDEGDELEIDSARRLPDGRWRGHGPEGWVSFVSERGTQLLEMVEPYERSPGRSGGGRLELPTPDEWQDFYASVGLYEGDAAIDTATVARAVSELLPGFSRPQALAAAYKALELTSGASIQRHELEMLFRHLLFFHERWETIEDLRHDFGEAIGLEQCQECCHALLGDARTEQQLAGSFSRLSRGQPDVGFDALLTWLARRAVGSLAPSPDRVAEVRQATRRTRSPLGLRPAARSTPSWAMESGPQTSILPAGQRREKFGVAVVHDIETSRQTAGGEQREPVSRARVGGGYDVGSVSPGGPRTRSPRPEKDDGEREVGSRHSPSHQTAVQMEIVTVTRQHDASAKAKALEIANLDERKRTKVQAKFLDKWTMDNQPRELRPEEQKEHIVVRRGGGYSQAGDYGRDGDAGWEQKQRAQLKQQQKRPSAVHHDGSPRRGDLKQQAHRSQVTMKPLQALDSADIEEGSEYHKLVQGTETSYTTSRAGGVRTSIHRPHQREPMYRVGGGYEIDHGDEHDTAMDGQIHELYSPSRHSRNTTVQAHRKERSTTSKNPKKAKRRAASAPNSDNLCRSPLDVVKIVMWFLLLHCFLEIWGMLFAFRDWFRCNFYPEYTDLMWDIVCCTFVAITAGFIAASTVGCDCPGFTRSSERMITRDSNWPKYLYTIACITALAVAMFGEHPTVVSNDPFDEELSVIRGAPDAPGSIPEGSGINDGRRRLAFRRIQEEEEVTCTEETDDEPIAWCVSTESEGGLEIAAAATNECTDVMKYAGCSSTTATASSSCAETMPYPSFHVQAEAGEAQNACILNSAGLLCKYEFSRRRNVVPCPPPPPEPVPPPPPPPTHGYAIVRCVESVWTARVLIWATMCRTIGAIGATLVSCAALVSTPREYVAPGPNRTPVADKIDLEEIKFDSTNETINGVKVSNGDERRDRAEQEMQLEGAGGGGGGGGGPRGPASPSLSPIQHNTRENTQFMTPAHV